MGLAASQARYLALTARKSDLEFQSQTINTRRIQLAYRTAEIAQAYTEGMNNKKIKYSSKDAKGNTSWSELTFANCVTKANCILIPTGGGIWADVTDKAPYTTDSGTVNYYYKTTDNTTKTEAEYNDLSDNDKKAYIKDGDTYRLITTISSDIYTNLSAEIKAKYPEANKIPLTEYTSTNVKVNREYGTSERDADIQSLLTSGRAQLVSLEFYSFLRRNGYDPLSATGSIPPEKFAQLQEEWDNSTDPLINPGQIHSIYDWRADETETFGERTYTEDDEAVLAKYEADTAEVQAQDKILEAQEKNIETQHKAIETELEAIQKVIQNNIDKTFKIFS